MRRWIFRRKAATIREVGSPDLFSRCGGHFGGERFCPFGITARSYNDIVDLWNFGVRVGCNSCPDCLVPRSTMGEDRFGDRSFGDRRLDLTRLEKLYCDCPEPYIGQSAETRSCGNFMRRAPFIFETARQRFQGSGVGVGDELLLVPTTRSSRKCGTRRGRRTLKSKPNTELAVAHFDEWLLVPLSTDSDHIWQNFQLAGSAERAGMM